MIHGHEHAVLWFSGGKDSLACLYLLRDQLAEVTVLWANTGKNYPEAMQVIEAAKAICPRWQEIRVDRDAQWERSGLPSDLLPMDATEQGQAFTCTKPSTIQSQYSCHWENINEPLLRHSKELGATLIITGQRKDEAHRSTSINGTQVGAFQFWHPIEEWTRAMVLDYLKANMGALPEHYAFDHTSLDCYDCTGFAAASHDRVAWMRERHPILFEDYREKLLKVYNEIETPLKQYQRLREEVAYDQC